MARNELYGFYDTVANGGTPAKVDLDAESIPTKWHRLVHAHVKHIHAARDAGNNGEARRLAREFADELREDLGKNWSPRDNAPPPPDDPSALADLVPRW